MKPLDGIFVLDFSQFLSAPSATLRLADLGAEVLKVEKPGGDICREMYTSNLVVHGESSLFQAINRNKDGIVLDLKSEEDRRRLPGLLKKADVVVVNYRPGVSRKIGIDYDTVHSINPRTVYAEITGYGYEGEWSRKPGQDLLVQALSGLCYLNGYNDEIPTPMGISAADLFAGQYLAQGILAALIERERTGEGALVQVNLLEAMLDVQSEGFTTYLNDNRTQPRRSSVNNANAYTSAPYGIYATKDGYLAIAMTPVPQLGELLFCPALCTFTDETTWSTERDAIKSILRDHLLTDTTRHWLELLEPAGIWCAKVNDWREFIQSDVYREIEATQFVEFEDGTKMEVTRCPISIDGTTYRSDKPAPRLGQHNQKYL